MTRLQTEPASAVQSLEELRALAITMKRGTAARYEQLAVSIENAGLSELAGVCHRLAAVSKASLQGFESTPILEGAAGGNSVHRQWQEQAIFDDEGLATASPQLMSPYRLLSTAVRNAERAFAFWSYVVAHAVNSEIRNGAEALAHAELKHIAALRRERRVAFHAARTEQIDSAEYDTSTNSLVEAEQALIAHLERSATMASQPLINRCSEFVHDGRKNVGFLETHSGMMAIGGGLRMSKNGNALDIAEFLAEAYLEGADRIQQEDLVREAQRMAGRAIERLAWLRDSI